MSSCIQCGKKIGSNVAFCPYCGTTSPNIARTPSQRPIIRKNEPSSDQRSTPVSPRAEDRTVRYQLPEDPLQSELASPSIGEEAAHEKRTLRRKIDAPGDSKGAQRTLRGAPVLSSSTLDAGATEMPGQVSPEDFRPTVRRMAPPSIEHKSPFSNSLSDPREGVDDRAALIQQSAVSSSDPLVPDSSDVPTPEVVRHDALVEPSEVAEKTMAIQMTEEMLDDLERRAASAALGNDIVSPRAKQAHEFQLAVGQDSDSDEDMASTQAMDLTAEQLHQMNLADANLAPPPAASGSDVIKEMAAVASSVPTPNTQGLEPAVQITAPAFDATPVANLPGRPVGPGLALEKLGQPGAGLGESVKYYFRSLGLSRSSQSAIRALSRRAKLLDEAADTLARQTGFDAWQTGRHEAVDGVTRQRLADGLQEFKQLQLVLEHSRTQHAHLLQRFESENHQDIQAMTQSQHLRDDFHGQLKVAERQLSETQSQLAKSDAPKAVDSGQGKAPAELTAIRQKIDDLVALKKQLQLKFNDADRRAIQTRQTVERARNAVRVEEQTAAQSIESAEQALETVRQKIEADCTTLGRAILMGHPTGLSRYPDSVTEIQQLISVRQLDDALRAEWELAQRSTDLTAAQRGKKVAIYGSVALLVSLVAVILMVSLLSGPTNEAVRDVPSAARNSGTSSVELSTRYLPPGLPFYAGISLDGLLKSPLLQGVGLQQHIDQAIEEMEAVQHVQSLVIGADKSPEIVAAQTRLKGEALESAFPDESPAKPLRRGFDGVHSDDGTGRVVAFKEQWKSGVIDQGESFTQDDSVKEVLESLDLGASVWAVSSNSGIKLLEEFIESESEMALLKPVVSDLRAMGLMVHVNTAAYFKVVASYTSKDAAETAKTQLDSLKRLAEEQLEKLSQLLDEKQQVFAREFIQSVKMTHDGRLVSIKVNLDENASKALLELTQAL